jgi:hypothetical protein
MTSDEAIRFLAHEAQRCRDRNAHEALCLLLPAMLKTLNLPPMEPGDVVAFDQWFHRELKRLQECEPPTSATFSTSHAPQPKPKTSFLGRCLCWIGSHERKKIAVHGTELFGIAVETVCERCGCHERWNGVEYETIEKGAA